MGKNPDTNYTNLHELKGKNPDTNLYKLMRKVITVIILVLIVGTQNLASLHAFTNRPSKPPVGARIDPLHSMNRGLVAWWLFNDGSGSSLTDITGKHNGSLINMDANDWVGSPRGGALDFDGSDDHVIVPASSDWAFGTGDFSVAFWVMPNVSQTWRVLVSNRDGGNNSVWKIGFGPSVENTINFHSGGTEIINGSTVLTTSTWSHVAATRSNGVIYLYINAVLDQSVANSFNFSTSNVLGIGYDGTWDNLSAQEPNARLDSLRIYKDRALSADEVAELYRNTYVGLWQSPVRWYGVDDPPASFTPTVTWW